MGRRAGALLANLTLRDTQHALEEGCPPGVAFMWGLPSLPTLPLLQALAGTRRPADVCGQQDLCPRDTGLGNWVCALQGVASPPKEASRELNPILCDAGPRANCSKGDVGS